LAAFMADLVWIEQVGARGFSALSRQAEDPTLAEIYRWFHAEEQRHANAELALMRRWGMVDEGEIPEPNNNIRLVFAWLDRFGDDLPSGVLGSVIPLLEVALDGALLKFLLEQVHDPLCHEVFERINNDESRHLAVDFHVLGLLGEQSSEHTLTSIAKGLTNPGVLTALPIAIPLFTKIRNSLVEMGLDESRLYESIERYGQLAARNGDATRNPSFRVLRRYGDLVVDEDSWLQPLSAVLVAISDSLPKRALGRPPSWTKELTYEPVA
ncbi:MAG: ferritin-like domain-containing protein, partial [Acidimicrobiales bacterium]